MFDRYLRNGHPQIISYEFHLKMMSYWESLPSHPASPPMHYIYLLECVYFELYVLVLTGTMISYY